MVKDKLKKLLQRAGKEEPETTVKADAVETVAATRSEAEVNLEAAPPPTVLETPAAKKARMKLLYNLKNFLFGKGGPKVEKPSTLEASLLPQQPEQVLETYVVNEPYAHVVIGGGNPPRYQLREVALSKGEDELLKDIKTRLYEVVDINLTDREAVMGYLQKKVDSMLKDLRIKLTPESKEKVMYYIARDLTGYGKLDGILRDPFVEDISGDGPNINLYVYHRRYGSLESNVMFTHEELDALIYKLAQRSGRHISLARPLLDASLPTKDRLQLSIGDEITTRGSTFSIRRFRETPFTPIDLVNYGTISIEMAAYFWMAVENGFNVLLAGGTASGKTSLLNALSMFIPANSKIVSLEDTREVNLLHQNWIPAVTRQSEGGHAIEMFDLLRSALRQRPEYLIVGEVRGREAYTLFQAMATGHYTLSTFHADSVQAVVRRLTKPPIDVPLMLLDSLNLIVQLGMVKVGEKRVRRVTSVNEVIEVDFANEKLQTNEVFHWKPDEFTFTGESKLFERMMNKLNLTEEELSNEFTRRVEILKYLKEKQINDFRKICDVFFESNFNPKEVERKMKEGVL